MTRRTVTALIMGTVLLALTGCVGAIGAPAALNPKLSPPVIARPGVLRAAVDMSYPPFAGKVASEAVGLDVDVAAAIADQLGLKLQLYDAQPAAAAALIQSGTVDIVLGALTVDSAVSSQVGFAGTYVSDAPAVFAAATATASVSATASTDTTALIAAIGGKRIAVQQGSLAYWTLLDAIGATHLIVTPTLADAFKDVSSGKADFVAGDALVGSYLLRAYPTFAYVGQLSSAYPLGVGVSQSNAKLETEIRSILDRLATQGVLETLRHKWVGDLAPLRVIDTFVDSSEPTSTVTSITP
jgi:polar amino acid transport system substrate-binding protein